MLCSIVQHEHPGAKIQYLLFGAFYRSFHVRPCTSADTDGIQSVVSQLNGADIIMR